MGAEAPLALRYRPAVVDDAALLAALNRQLIADEGHGNPMTEPELEARMRGWLSGEYAAALFEADGAVAAYVLYREEPDGVYIRHLFVDRALRRRGIATRALRFLAREVWPPDARLTIEVLTGNAGAMAFYERIGFRPYALTLCADAAELAQGIPGGAPDGPAAARSRRPSPARAV